jgi:hypothetical protein
MAYVDESKREINVKISFLGAHVGGLRQTLPADEVGDLIALGDLQFFTSRPAAQQLVSGERLVLHVYGSTATGDAKVMRNLLLGAEALVLVISTKSTRIAEASRLLERAGSLPFVVQLADDHADAVGVPELRAALALHDVPMLASIREAFHAVVRLAVAKLAEP